MSKVSAVLIFINWGIAVLDAVLGYWPGFATCALAAIMLALLGINDAIRDQTDFLENDDEQEEEGEEWKRHDT